MWHLSHRSSFSATTIALMVPSRMFPLARRCPNWVPKGCLISAASGTAVWHLIDEGNKDIM